MPIFLLLQRYIPLALKFQRAGILMLSLSPFIGSITRSPAGLLLPLAGGVIAALFSAATYLIVLP